MNTTTIEFSFDENTVSDLHKDAYGFRPCQNWWADWGSSNPVGKQQIWDELIEALERSIERDNEDTKLALDRFNTLVTKTIEAGAKDRETAIEWLRSTDEMYKNDVGYFEYCHGIPYGTVNGKKWC